MKGVQGESSAWREGGSGGERVVEVVEEGVSGGKRKWRKDGEEGGRKWRELVKGMRKEWRVGM